MARKPGVSERVRRFLDSLDPMPRGMVVAVSGGADSVALLRALRTEFDGPLVVAHLNHGLRGLDSDADAEFVAKLSSELKLPVHIERREVPAGGNLEATARRIRYDWLRELAQAAGADFVATGHTADDQAETVLFRLLRGTGLHGLRGIARKRRLADGVSLIRPLLDVRRSELEAYLAALQQPWRRDASNADRRFTRNSIRHDLLPKLAGEYNPRVVESLVRLAQQARHWRRMTARETRRTLARCELPRAGYSVVLDQSALEAVSTERAADLWAAIWRRERWPAADMGSREFQRIVEWFRSGSAALELPGGIRIVRRERTIVAGPA